MVGDVRRFWVAIGVSAGGSSLSAIAIPMVALLQLRASGFEMGLLTSIDQWAWLVLGLVAGMWVDRLPKLRVLIAVDLLRAVLFAVIVVFLVTGAASMVLLLVVGFAVGLCDVFEVVAHGTVGPLLVGKAELVRVNSRVNSIDAVSRLSGGSVAGAVVAGLGAPVALVADCVSFLVSAFLIRGMSPLQEQLQRNEHVFAGVVREVRQGLVLVLGQRLYRVLLLSSSVYNACAAAQYVLIVLLLKYLHTAQWLYGVLMSAGGVGALLGSAVVPRLVGRWGQLRVWRVFLVVGPVIGLLVPCAFPGIGLVFLVVGSVGLSASVMVTSIISFTIRQTVCPPQMLGRMAAFTRMLTWGVIPLAAMAGGVLGQAVNPRTALFIVAGFFFLEPLIIALSPSHTFSVTVKHQRVGS